MLAVDQFPMLSPIPSAEKAILGLVKVFVFLKLLSTYQFKKLPEELIFKFINLMWELKTKFWTRVHNTISEQD